MFNILLIEDSSDDIFLVRRIAEKISKDIFLTVAYNAAEAIKCINNSTKYDLVICDVNIPGGNYIETIKIFKLKAKETPFYIFSDSPDPPFSWDDNYVTNEKTIENYRNVILKYFKS